MLPLLLGALISGPELEHCGLAGIFFTSERNGLAVDRCGSAFVTRDGGVSWSKRATSVPTTTPGRDTLTMGATLSDGSLLLVGTYGWQVLRSSDNGESWKPFRTTSGQWVYSLSHRGRLVWTCGSDGLVLGSADFGQTWRTTKARATDGDNRCISLSFLDEKRGWVAGWHGTVFETVDGGETWRKLELPAPFTGGAPGERGLDAVFRFDARIGWVTGPRGSFRTLDGGESWQPYELEDKVKAVALHDGQRLLVTARSAEKGPEGWEPVLRIMPVARGSSSAWVDGRSVIIEENGSDRVGRLTGPASADRPREGTVRTPFGTTKTAVGQRRGFISEDDGRSWRELGALPRDEVFEELVFLNQRTAIARAAGGALFHSDDEGAHWKASTNLELDAADLDTARGVSTDRAFECLRSPSGTLTIEFGVQGCFGGSKSTLGLKWTPAGGEVRVTTNVPDLAEHPVRLEPANLRRQLTTLREEVLRSESPSPCWSTNQYLVAFEVRCQVGAKMQKQTLTLTSSECGQRSSGAASARAIRVHDWAAAFLPARSLK